MSRFSNSVIGPHSRHLMKDSSPYATLMLDISMGLCQEDVSSLKLALQVDKYVKRMHLCKLKNGSEILSHMYDIGLISETDTQFLENLLIHICRKDLVKKIERYHAKRSNVADDKKSTHHLPDTTSSENTVPKQVYEAYDSDTNVSSSTGIACKSPVKNMLPMKPVENRPKGGGTDMTDFTALKTPANQYYHSPQSVQNSAFSLLGARSVPDGHSFSTVYNSKEPDMTHGLPVVDCLCNLSDLSNSSASSQSDIEMKNSQRCSGSQDSQMSISDDEKLGYSQDKALFTDGDSSLSNMQLSQ